MTDLFRTSGSSPTPDFEFESRGSVCLLRPVTPIAKTWIEENLSEDRMMFCNEVVIEPRYVGHILDGIRADGFEVRQ
jgi:hypothetical protein